MKATQRVSALRGGQPDDLIASGAGYEGISLRGAWMRRKIGPNRPGIRGMSVNSSLRGQASCQSTIPPCLASNSVFAARPAYLKVDRQRAASSRGGARRQLIGDFVYREKNAVVRRSPE